MFISFAIVSISSGPLFLKYCFNLLHSNVFAGQSPTFPTIMPSKIDTYRIYYWDVGRMKDRERPYLNHLGKKLAVAFVTPSLAAIVCWRVLRGA